MADDYPSDIRVASGPEPREEKGEEKVEEEVDSYQ